MLCGRKYSRIEFAIGLAASLLFAGCKSDQGPTQNARTIALIQKIRSIDGLGRPPVMVPEVVVYSDGTIIRQMSSVDSALSFVIGRLEPSVLSKVGELSGSLFSDSIANKDYYSESEEAGLYGGCYFIQSGGTHTVRTIWPLRGYGERFDSIPGPLLEIAQLLLQAKVDSSVDWIADKKEVQFLSDDQEDNFWLNSKSKKVEIIPWPDRWVVSDSFYLVSKRNLNVLSTELSSNDADKLLMEQYSLSKSRKVYVRNNKAYMTYKSRIVFPDDHEWKSSCRLPVTTF